MVKIRRGWNNPAKENKPTTEGSCPYCHKHVKALEAHISSKHKGQKPKKRWIWKISPPSGRMF